MLMIKSSSILKAFRQIWCLLIERLFNLASSTKQLFIHLLQQMNINQYLKERQRRVVIDFLNMINHCQQLMTLFLYFSQRNLQTSFPLRLSRKSIYHYLVNIMRHIFSQAFQDIQNLQNHKQIVTTPSSSIQETFLQTLANIVLCNHKEPIGDILPILASYRGSFSNQILSFKYCTYCMEKDKSKSFNVFTILKLLSKWVQTLDATKKKKDIRLYQALVENLELGISTYEEFIVYLNYIAYDIINLVKSGTDESRKKYPDLSKHPHLDASDLTKALNVILPKTLVNMMVPRNFFPPTLLRSTDESIDILYSNQNYENIAQTKSHYNSLLRLLIKTLLSMQLESNQIKELVLNCFKYFYLYHYDKNYNASQFVIESFKKMNSAVRFAILDEISLFFITIKKLGKQLFLSYLTEKFTWVGEIIRSKNVLGINKSTLKPFHNQLFSNSLKVKVEPGKIENFYLQVYERFSLVYFCIKCLEYDITIRFYYLGDFQREEGTDEKKLLISSQKKEGLLEGSVQTIDKGIYMFEFDNSYAWMKAKALTVDTSILVPIQIKQQKKNKIKEIVYEKTEHLNEVPFENVIGWVDEEEIKINSTASNVTSFLEQRTVIYRIKIVKNTGQSYEYETESKQRLIKKVYVLSMDPNIYWLIEGQRVRGVNQVEKWISGEAQAQKFVDQNQQQQQNQGNEVDTKIEKQDQSPRKQEKDGDLQANNNDESK